MRLGVLLPTRGFVMADARRPRTDEIRAMARAADAAGYSHVWVGDSVVAKPRHEPLTTLAHCAAITERVGLATAVLLPSLRQPVQLAAELATVDHLSKGRLLLGVGPGWHLPSAYEEAAALGVDHKRRAPRLEEHIRTWRELWSGRPVTMEGSDFRLNAQTIGPLPWNPEGPPILVTAGNRGAFVEAALDRFARLGDGIITTSVFAAECRELRERGEAALAAAGRKLPGFPIAVYVTVRLDPSAARAEEVFDAFLSAYYGPNSSGERGERAIGDAATVGEVLERYAEAGVSDVCIRFAGDDQLAQLDLFSSEVLPAFTG